MPFSEKLADRIREIIAVTHKDVEEKKMFAGLCFMVNDKMCIGVHEDRIMVRLDPGIFDEVIEKEGCTPMNFTGKVMRGFVFVNESVLKTRKQVEFWVKLGLDYNQFAKSSKKAPKKSNRLKK
jgi:TfoX/Sxy family transcriptional regulator of competence genes